MSVLTPPNGDESPECPLCMECLELDDISFYACSCGYQICRFCWNKIRTEGNGLCPACRSPYTENPAGFKPLTAEELAKIKAEKRQKDQAKKQKISENRKHLANVRVVQKNLVFVVGLSPRLSDLEILRKSEYFGKFGKIHKVVINHSTAYAGNQNQGPSASAYVTYFKWEDALRAIQAVNNISIDGRTLKASLGTTKYCSHFMKNQSCPKHDCMYLHELGDEAASFTKEEMQQGKHTDYERSLHEEMLMQSQISESDKPRDAKSPSPKESWPNLSFKSNFPDEPSNRIRDENIPSFERDNASNPGNSFYDGGVVIPGGSAEQHNGGADLASSAFNNAQDAVYDSTELRKWSCPNETKPTTANVSTDDDDDDGGGEEEDELGFDPFHETQKALAEMLESESKLFQENSSSSSDVIPPHQTTHSSFTSTRSKLPPPGFNMVNVNPSNLSNDIHSFLPSNLDSLSSSQFSPSGFLNGDFGYRNHLHYQQPPTENLLRNGDKINSYPSKDWQEGLRALLPNVSFGHANNGYHHSMGGHRGDGGPSTSQQQQQKYSPLNERAHGNNNGWNSNNNNVSSNDWTVLDPAIVGGQLADSRSNSPPNWIKANLEQLTETPCFNQVGSILPAFANLGLSGGSSSGPQQLQHHWGQSTPPPGFSRAPMPNQYSTMTSNEGHQIESTYG